MGREEEGGTDGTPRRRLGVRELTPATARQLLRTVGVLYLSTGAAALLAGASATHALHSGAALTVAGGTGVAVGAVLAVGAGAIGDERLVRTMPALAWVLLVGATVALSIGIYGVGPTFQVTTPIYAVIALFAFYLLDRPLAIANLVLIGGAFAVVLRVEGEVIAPVAQWVYLMTVVSTVAVVVGAYVAHADQLAASERDARAALAQVMRRFLAAPVADAVISGEGAAFLEPHRRRIAVFFCDLRGFTAFSSAAQPEEVGSVLTAYFELLGDTVARYEATVGGLTGDGLMAFFNDPVPCTDPVGRAVDMAMDARDRMEPLLAEWRRWGFDLGVGFGVAYGYANIGIIGFEGRRDYSALGPVVNLAARLCSEAPAGCIYLDRQACAAMDGRMDTSAVLELTLKGYANPVPAYAL